MFGFFFSWFIGQQGPKISCTKTQILPNLRLPIRSAHLRLRVMFANIQNAKELWQEAAILHGRADNTYTLLWKGKLRSTALGRHPASLWRHNVWPLGVIFSSAPVAGVWYCTISPVSFSSARPPPHREPRHGQGLPRVDGAGERGRHRHHRLRDRRRRPTPQGPGPSLMITLSLTMINNWS